MRKWACVPASAYFPPPGFRSRLRAPCTPAPAQPSEAGPDYRDELLEELRDRVRSLEAANRENRRIIAALTSRIPQLEAPRDEPQAPESASEGADRVEGEGRTDVGDAQEASGRHSSWWRRWFGFE